MVSPRSDPRRSVDASLDRLGPEAESVCAFRCEMHLEEAGWLHTQRNYLIAHPEGGVDIDDIASYEARADGHLRALEKAGTFATEVAIARLRDHQDASEISAALRFFCRIRRWDLILAVLDLVDWEDEDHVIGIREGLKHDFPADWVAFVQERLGTANDAEAALWARVSGARRLPIGPAVFERARTSASPQTLPDYLWALGRLRVPKSEMWIYRHAQEGDKVTKITAALAILKFATSGPPSFFRTQAASHPWAWLPVALSARQPDEQLWQAALDRGEWSSELFTVLGLFGSLTSIERLIDALDDPKAAEGAATALYTLTGAELWEEVFVADDASDEAEGTTILRISQEAARWKAWLKTDGKSLQRNVRYRAGVPYTPQAAWNATFLLHIPPQWSHYAIDELEIRYGISSPFLADDFVARKRKARVLPPTQTRPAKKAGVWRVPSPPLSSHS